MVSLMYNSSLIKYKDVTIDNVRVSIKDGNGYYAPIKTLSEIASDYETTVSATVVAWSKIPGLIIPYMHVDQKNPMLYIYSTTEGVLENVIVRVCYLSTPLLWKT